MSVCVCARMRIGGRLVYRDANVVLLRTELKLVKDGLNVGPDDQSLWYYHQCLMLHITEPARRPAIAPDLSLEERLRYVRQEIVDVKDLQEDFEDVKWIYEALMEYTLALCGLSGREPGDEERADLREWLANLTDLDPMRKGRYDEMGRQLGME